MSQLEGKVVVITGAAGGISRPICQLLASEGCRLGLLDLQQESLQDLSAELADGGAEVAAAKVDVSDRDAVVESIRSIERDLGTVDVLIHNAGVMGITDARNVDIEAVEQMLEVNYLGGVYAVEAVLPSMLSRRSGQLVAISSLSARCGLPWMAGYCASKAATTSFMESLRQPLRKHGVYVTTCHPGYVLTPPLAKIPFRGTILVMGVQSAAENIVGAIKQKKREANFPRMLNWWLKSTRLTPDYIFDWISGEVGKRCLPDEY